MRHALRTPRFLRSITVLALLGSSPFLAGQSLAAQSEQAGAQPNGSNESAVNNYPPALLKILGSGNIKVIREFSTPKPDVTGFVLHRPGGPHSQDAIVYGYGRMMFAGHMFGESGQDLTKQHRQQFVPSKDMAEVVDQIEAEGQPVTQGADDAPVLYAFIDPNCIFCHRFYESAEPLIEAGRLQVRWVLVGFLKASSLGRSAAILAADDSVAAIKRNEEGFVDRPEQGGIEPMDPVDPALRQLIRDNSKLMKAAGGNGTPTLLYKRDGKWQTKVGAPGQAWLQEYAAPAEKTGDE